MAGNDTSLHTLPVKSIGRALQIIDFIAKENNEAALTDIAKALDWPKSTVYGLIAALREFRYVEQSEKTGKYKLGARLFELGNIVARRWDIRTVAVPVMRDLCSISGETVHLAVADGGEVLYLEKVESSHMVSIISETGARLPMHCTGLGKVLLAYKTEPEAKWIIAKHGLVPMTGRTITDQAKLMLELKKIKEQGYAVDDGEIMDNLYCIAVPVFSLDKKADYAISLSIVNSRTQDYGRYAKLLELLKSASGKISYAMGYRPENI